MIKSKVYSDCRGKSSMINELAVITYRYLSLGQENKLICRCLSINNLCANVINCSVNRLIKRILLPINAIL